MCLVLSRFDSDLYYQSNSFRGLWTNAKKCINTTVRKSRVTNVNAEAICLVYRACLNRRLDLSKSRIEYVVTNVLCDPQECFRQFSGSIRSRHHVFCMFTANFKWYRELRNLANWQNRRSAIFLFKNFVFASGEKRVDYKIIFCLWFCLKLISRTNSSPVYVILNKRRF